MQYSYVKVKTAELKNNLSRYLSSIRQTGESITVCDRDKPIATLSPIMRKDDEEWAKQRKELQEKAAKLGLSIQLPLRRPDGRKKYKPSPTVAPDGRTDISTIDLERKGRDY